MLFTRSFLLALRNKEQKVNFSNCNVTKISQIKWIIIKVSKEIKKIHISNVLFCKDNNTPKPILSHSGSWWGQNLTRLSVGQRSSRPQIDSQSITGSTQKHETNKNKCSHPKSVQNHQLSKRAWFWRKLEYLGKENRHTLWSQLHHTESN